MGMGVVQGEGWWGWWGWWISLSAYLIPYSFHGEGLCQDGLCPEVGLCRETSPPPIRKAGSTHPTGMHSFLPPANEVWGKVIFLHLFVILFTGGVSASVHAGIPPPRSRHPPGADTPLGVDTPLGADTPPPAQSMLRDTVNGPTGMQSWYR